MLSPEDVTQLSRPFPLEAHEWRKGRNNKDYVYITESGVVARLNEVDPSWALMVVDRAEREYSATKTNSQTGEKYTLTTRELAITVSLVVKDVTRYGVGMAEIAVDAAEADKSAVTDALKRAARLFGVGAYLLNNPPGKAQFPQWLAQLNAPPAANGWTRDEAASFNLGAKRLNVSTDEVLAILGVSKLSEYAPGFSVALEQLQQYAAARPKTATAPVIDLFAGDAD
jgi:hypothetical protein